MPRKKRSIVMAAAECAPFVKVGGLGDVVGSLPQALAARKLTVSVVLPFYRFIKNGAWHFKKEGTVTVTRDEKTETITVWSAKLPKTHVAYFFLDHPLLATANVYTRRDGAEPDIDPDIEKFSFYAEAVVETINQLHIPADSIHCHDWHAGLIPTFVDQLAVKKSYPFTATILTIHNLGNQGNAPRDLMQKLRVGKKFEPAILEDYYDLDDNRLNIMKLGILTADAVTTVSPTYAKEILTPEYGCGLESFLARRKKHLSGIMNGIDTNLFNPATDGMITTNYALKNWEQGKAANKKTLLQTLGLSETNAPLYGLISRLVAQKGLDILVQTLEEFLHRDVRVVILGTGEKNIEEKLTELAKRFPGKIRCIIDFDLKLAERIYAGADFFLMPSRFEPCGLGQMIAMRYGTVPIVRATGGLKDTVRHMKTGIVFKNYESEALSRALNQSLKLYADTKKRNTMVVRGMRQYFSWDASAKKYLKLYTSLAV